jgi:hypothetical protein
MSKDSYLFLGHALYMKAIHGGKAKNDKIESPTYRIAGRVCFPMPFWNVHCLALGIGAPALIEMALFSL